MLRIYFRSDPRDPASSMPSEDVVEEPYSDLFRRIWAQRGLTPEQIQARWDEGVKAGKWTDDKPNPEPLPKEKR